MIESVQSQFEQTFARSDTDALSNYYRRRYRRPGSRRTPGARRVPGFAVRTGSPARWARLNDRERSISVRHRPDAVLDARGVRRNVRRAWRMHGRSSRSGAARSLLSGPFPGHEQPRPHGGAAAYARAAQRDRAWLVRGFFSFPERRPPALSPGARTFGGRHLYLLLRLPGPQESAPYIPGQAAAQPCGQHRPLLSRPATTGGLFVPEHVPGSEPLQRPGNLLALAVHRA